MQKSSYQLASERATRWLEQMLVAVDGSQGIYERYRINLGRINPWVRPDCSIEAGRLFYVLGERLGDVRWRNCGLQLARFVCSLQRSAPGFLHGSFPFYSFHPQTPGERDIGEDFGIFNLPARAWPNDNGKITEYLLWFYQQTGDPYCLERTRYALDYLVRIQADDGAFRLTMDGEEPNYNAVDFVAWPTVALIQGALATGEERYRHHAWRGLCWLRDHQHPSGRMLTGMETANFEPWRPPASETVMALHAVAQATLIFAEPWLFTLLGQLADTLLAWQHPSGGIRNCDEAARRAALQNAVDVADLVYVNSYALIALQEAHAATGEARYAAAIHKLADFLVKIQCWGESRQWDGGWRGSYHLDEQRWYGAADQQNTLEEGGMNTVYTGWCVAPIAYGLLYVG